MRDPDYQRPFFPFEYALLLRATLAGMTPEQAANWHRWNRERYGEPDAVVDVAGALDDEPAADDLVPARARIGRGIGRGHPARVPRRRPPRRDGCTTGKRPVRSAWRNPMDRHARVPAP